MNLMSLLSVAPSKCIILIEDIDSAFPTRTSASDDTDDASSEEEGDGEEGALERPTSRRTNPPRSWVTLAGLLNALDGLISEEGRIVFATTNFIEVLDPALIRPGRMDVKVQYNLATHEQIIQTFSRFYPAHGLAFRGRSRQQGQKGDGYTGATQETSDIITANGDNKKHDKEIPPTGMPEMPVRHNDAQVEESPVPNPAAGPKVELVGGVKSRRGHHGLSAEVLQGLGREFANRVPAGTYSIAQLQGFLMTRKNNPHGAVEDVEGWMEEQRRQRQRLREGSAKRPRRVQEEQDAAEEWHDALDHH